MSDSLTLTELCDDAFMASRRARRDLERTASAYRLIAAMAANVRPLAMRVCVVRPYVFERNLKRWPDGKFHLLDRQYQPWLGHEIAHTEDELRALGLHDWQASSAVQIAFARNFLPLVDDVLQNYPARRPHHLRMLAALLDRIAARQEPEPQ